MIWISCCVVRCQLPSNFFRSQVPKLGGFGGALAKRCKASGGRDGRHPAGHRIRALPSGTAARCDGQIVSCFMVWLCEGRKIHISPLQCGQMSRVGPLNPLKLRIFQLCHIEEKERVFLALWGWNGCRLQEHAQNRGIIASESFRFSPTKHSCTMRLV